MIQINPIVRLRELLDAAKIPYENVDSIGISRVKYPSYAHEVCSAIWGIGTYGYEAGAIEIMGLLTPEEEAYGCVTGWLTPEEVFSRIEAHYRKEVNDGEA